MGHLYPQEIEKKEVFQEIDLKEPLQCFKQLDLLSPQITTIQTHHILTVALFHHQDHHLATHQAVLHQVALQDQVHLPAHLVEDALLSEDNIYFKLRKNEKISFHCFHSAFFRVTSPISI